MKRFETERQIIVLIDKYREQIAAIKGAAEAKDHLADCLRTTEESNRIPELRAAGETLRARVKWMEGRLETLGQKLSEIRTPQLPGVDNGDNSVTTK